MRLDFDFDPTKPSGAASLEFWIDAGYWSMARWPGIAIPKSSILADAHAASGQRSVILELCAAL
jgi:hypothetical protein